MIKMTLKLISAALLCCAFVYSAQAVEEYSNPAVGGYDTVAYFTQSKAVKGSGVHSHTHDGQVYLFSSKENKAKFIKKPNKYAPQFGGYCAFGAAKGKKFHSDPTVFAVVKKKLYLNLNKDIQAQWNEGRSKMIKQGHKNWKKIRTASASSL